MTARYQGSRLELVEKLLRERGPMTARRIAEELDMPVHRVSVTIAGARSRRPGNSFRAVRYEPQTGQRSPDHPVWSASPGRDAERPPYDLTARRAAWEARRRERHGVQRNAQQQIARAAKRGRPPVLNHYLQLVKPSARGYLSAANSLIKDAA